MVNVNRWGNISVIGRHATQYDPMDRFDELPLLVSCDKAQDDPLCGRDQPRNELFADPSSCLHIRKLLHERSRRQGLQNQPREKSGGWEGRELLRCSFP